MCSPENVFSVECVLILGSCVSAPRRPQAETAQVVLDIKDSFKKFDVNGSGTLNAKEFEQWFVAGGRGDARQAKAAFREVDRSPNS
jgi:Ca2+-binding EF-hand superfamily protein